MIPRLDRILVILALLVGQLAAHPARVRARRRVPARALLDASRVRAWSSSFPASSRWCASTCASWSLDVPSQDVISRDNVTREGQRGAVLPRRRSAAGGDPGRELPRRDQPARADHACARCSASTTSTRCCAERERLNLDLQKILDSQTDAWGIKVDQRRDQARRPQRNHDPRDRAPGRGRARAARQGDPRRGRAAGRREAGRRPRRSWRGSRRRSSCATWRR